MSPASTSAAIRFGTSGWRGVLADEVTGPRARALAAAVARWVAASERGAKDILVAHDTRFLGAQLAARVARALAAAGARPVPVASPCPTPLVANAVRRGRGDAAIVVTASHNAPAYQGMKVFGPSGGGVTGAEARRIEALAARALLQPGPVDPIGRALPAAVDLVPSYVAELARHLDREALRSAGAEIVYDALHGTGAGVCDRALRAVGLRVDVLHGQPSPRFGGVAPDPTPANLMALARAVRARGGRAFGLATDGDADRYAVLDERGRPLTESEALALLVDHLARTGRARRGVAISVATGTWVEQVAAEHGLAVERHPIGFKHLSRALAEGTADVAGEESGGFAWEPIARDKDGILACALLAELAATAPLRARLRILARRLGPRLCGRVACRATPDRRAWLGSLCAAPPERVGGARVRAADTTDGLRLRFDDGFLMLRASGTEPVLRIYAEAVGSRALARRFAAGRRLLRAAARS